MIRDFKVCLDLIGHETVGVLEIFFDKRGLKKFEGLRSKMALLQRLNLEDTHLLLNFLNELTEIVTVDSNKKLN